MAVYEESVKFYEASMEPPEDAITCWYCGNNGERIGLTWHYICKACDVKWAWSPTKDYEKDQQLKREIAGT